MARLVVQIIPACGIHGYMIHRTFFSPAAFVAYLGFVNVLVAHTHPVMLMFCQLLVNRNKDRGPEEPNTKVPQERVPRLCKDSGGSVGMCIAKLLRNEFVNPIVWDDFHLNDIKLIPEQLLQPITTAANNAVSQSELEAITFNRRQARENACYS